MADGVPSPDAASTGDDVVQWKPPAADGAGRASPLAELWRRIAAWAIDVVLLGVFGQVLGWTLSSVWFGLGPYGRLVGLPIMLLYFGVSASSVAKGQSPGKRLLRLAVVGADGKPVGLGRGLLRAAVLVVPYTLNGWGIPEVQHPALQWVVAVLVFGVGGAVGYTMVFNRAARQGVHDLIAGTHVIRTNVEPALPFPATPRLHRVVAGVIGGAAALLATVMALLGSALVSMVGLAGLQQIQHALQADERFFTVGVQSSEMHAGGGQVTHLLQVEVWCKGRPSKAEADAVMVDVARVLLDRAERFDSYDVIRIRVTSAFDLGIASSRMSHYDGEKPGVWRERVAAQGPR